MRSKTAAAFRVFSAVFSIGAANGSVVQSQASFEAAIRNHSTAPSYVLLTVVDAKTARARTGCTTANGLMGAIHLEFGFDYDEAGKAKAERIVLENYRHVFRFSRRSALENIPF